MTQVFPLKLNRSLTVLKKLILWKAIKNKILPRTYCVLRQSTNTYDTEKHKISSLKKSQIPKEKPLDC